MRRAALAVLASSVLFGCSVPAAETGSPTEESGAPPDAWLDSGPADIPLSQCAGPVDTPITLVDGLYLPSTLLLANGSLYWADVGVNGFAAMLPNRIMTALADGTGESPLFVGSEVYPTLLQGGPPMAIQADNLYWADTLDTISSLPLGGGAQVLVAKGLGGVQDIAISADGSLYYLSLEGIGRINTAGEVTTVYVGEVIGLALDANYVYFGEPGTPSVKRMNYDGSEVKTLATAVGVNTLAVDSTGLYVGGGDATLTRVSLDGSTATPLFSFGHMATIEHVALDEGFAYLTIGFNYAPVVKVAKDTGACTFLANSETFADGIAVDTSFVYWTTSDTTGALRRVPK